MQAVVVVPGRAAAVERQARVGLPEVSDAGQAVAERGARAQRAGRVIEAGDFRTVIVVVRARVAGQARAVADVPEVPLADRARRVGRALGAAVVAGLAVWVGKVVVVQHWAGAPRGENAREDGGLVSDAQNAVRRVRAQPAGRVRADNLRAVGGEVAHDGRLVTN